IFKLPCPQKTTLFPSTTLFRSDDPHFKARFLPQRMGAIGEMGRGHEIAWRVREIARQVGAARADPASRHGAVEFGRVALRRHGRSEEHTSELQSRENLVCRLPL